MPISRSEIAGYGGVWTGVPTLKPESERHLFSPEPEGHLFDDYTTLVERARYQRRSNIEHLYSRNREDESKKLGRTAPKSTRRFTESDSAQVTSRQTKSRDQSSNGKKKSTIFEEDVRTLSDVVFSSDEETHIQKRRISFKKTTEYVAGLHQPQSRINSEAKSKINGDKIKDLTDDLSSISLAFPRPPSAPKEPKSLQGRQFGRFRSYGGHVQRTSSDGEDTRRMLSLSDGFADPRIKSSLARRNAVSPKLDKSSLLNRPKWEYENKLPPIGGEQSMRNSPVMNETVTELSFERQTSSQKDLQRLKTPNKLPPLKNSSASGLHFRF